MHFLYFLFDKKLTEKLDFSNDTLGINQILKCLGNLLNSNFLL